MDLEKYLQQKDLLSELRNLQQRIYRLENTSAQSGHRDVAMYSTDVTATVNSTTFRPVFQTVTAATSFRLKVSVTVALNGAPGVWLRMVIRDPVTNLLLQTGTTATVTTSGPVVYEHNYQFGVAPLGTDRLWQLEAALTGAAGSAAISMKSAYFTQRTT